jgi:ArsR family transcriptional regulator
MNESLPVVLDQLATIADATRGRMLLLVDRRELTVSELCSVMQIPQSTASRHLKALADAGWVVSRAEGTSNLYSMTRTDLETPARRMWAVVRDELGRTAVAHGDQRRLKSVLAERKQQSQAFFSKSAGEWDRVRDEQFGDRFHLASLAGLADPSWVAGDLGCGTGAVSAALAPFVSRVVAVDSSSAMLQAAKRRLHDVENVELRRGDLEALPIADSRLDLATMMLVLHHLAEPSRAMADVARVLKPGGRLVIVDMLPHDRESYRAQMGHVWLGFSDADVRRLFAEAGFEDVRIVALEPDTRVKGPGLFTATARRQVEHRRDGHTSTLEAARPS